MPAPNFCVLPASLIPLGSTEPLCEWDIVTDALFFSTGARKALNLESAPATMHDFYALLPPTAVMELQAMHEGMISGRTGSLLDYGYMCNGMWMTEHLLVVSRDTSGRATRALGRLSATPILAEHGVICRAASVLPDTGVWAYHVPTKRIWRDKVCGAILGDNAERHFPVSDSDSLLDVHPAERVTLRLHYELFCRDDALGDTITDLVRVRQANGSYTPILVRASMAQRDRAGKGEFIVGVMARCEGNSPDLSYATGGDGILHALDSMGSGQWNWNTSTDVMYFCPRYLAMLGYTPEQGLEIGRNWQWLIHPEDMERVGTVREAIIRTPHNGDAYECTYRMRKADGSWIWIFDRGFVTWRDNDGRAGHMVGSSTNITTAQADRDKLEKLVRHDSLTGLRSRAHCNLELEHLEQNRIRPVSIISVDITGLKMINDNLGHLTGDEALTRAAAVLRGSLRATDCIARMGGDEFLVLLPNCTNEKGQKLLRKIENSFESYNTAGGHIPVFAACGLATSVDMNESLQQTIARADDAMYRAKRQQRPRALETLRAWIRERTGLKMIEDDRIS